MFRILGNMFFPKRTASQQRPGSSREYELVNSSNIESGSQHGIAYAAATSAQDDIVIAEAYIVPPLAEVVNADPAVSGQDSNRIHELQELTTENKDGGFRDRWAALLFIINVGIIVYLFVQSFYMLRFPASDETNAEKTESNYDFGLIKVIVAFAVLLTTFAAASGSWILSFLMQHAENLIEMVMWGNIAIQGTCAVLCLLTLQLLGAIIFAIFAGLNYWYLISVRDQIPFSSTVLATACTAVKANYTGLVTTAFSALFVQMVWALLWTVAFIGVMYASSEEKDAQTKRTLTVTPVDHSQHASHDDFHTTDDTDDGAQQDGVPAFYLFLLFVSLYWGIQVIKAVVQTTVAGTLACWWFQPKREAPVRGSLFRALTTSFGSLCFGSLIVALIQALREMLQLLKRQMQRSDGRSHNVLAGCVLAIVDVLMGWIDQAVQYFNKYAYCYVAAYGLDFISSGRLVSSLFYNRGWTAIINDNLISRALFCGVVAMTVANMVVGVLLSLLFDLVLAHSAHEVGTLALIGGLVGAVSGLIVGIVLTNALDSAVAMVYVCFAESPKALQENHPEVYTELRSKWESLHPHTLAWWTGSDRTAHPSVRAVPTQPSPVAAPRPAAASVYHAPHSVYQPPNAGSPYNPYAASPGYNAYGGYSGYGGYGAAGSVGAQQSSPSSAVYDPNYNAALYAHQVGRTAGPSAVANPMHGVDGGKHLPPPSAPPGY